MSLNELKDFYFSKEQLAICLESAEASIPHKPYFLKFFYGRQYTECVKHGKQLTSKFEDFIFIGTGYSEDCNFKRG